MAPEQARGEPSDRRSDVFALGATLYHVLAGHAPLAGMRATQMVVVAARGERLALALPDEVPAELGAIVHKATAPEPELRYRDAGELAADLRRFLAGQLVAAHRYTARQRLGRFLARHRIAVAIAAVSVVALAATGAVALNGVFEARDDARDAEAREGARADEALVERARSLAATDPTRALAVLKQLPVTSPAWHRARDVAEVAVAAGPGRGCASNILRPLFSQLVASPDGSRFAVTDEARILIGDMALPEPPHLVAELPGAPSGLVWLDGDALIANVAGRLFRVELGGRVSALEGSGLVRAVLAVGDGRLFAIAEGHLRELDPCGGPPRADLGETGDALRVPFAVIYGNGRHIVFLPDDGAPVVVGPDRAGGAPMASTDGALRIAVPGEREIREFELGPDGFVLRGAWPIARNAMFQYSGDRLVELADTRLAWLAPDAPPAWQELPILRSGRAYAGNPLLPVDAGVIVVGYDKLLLAREGGTPIELAARPDALDEVAVAGDHILGLSARGELQAWRVSQIVPPGFAFPASAMLLEVGTRHAWLSYTPRDGGERFMRVDLESGAVRDVSLAFLAPVADFVCELAGHAVFAVAPEVPYLRGGPMRLEAVDLRSNAHRELSRRVLRHACDAGAGVLVEASRADLAVRRAPALDQVAAWFPLDEPPVLLSASAGWIAVVDAHNTLTRIEIASGRREVLALARKPDKLVVADDGKIAVSGAESIVVWPVGGAQRITVDHVDAVSLMANPLGFVAFTSTLQLVVIAATGQVTRWNVGDGALPWVPRQATTAYTSSGGRLTMLDLVDGTVATFPWRADEVMSSDDGSVAIVRLHGDPRGIIVRRRLPDQPLALRGWLHAATNATLEPGSAVLTWTSDTVSR